METQALKVMLVDDEVHIRYLLRGVCRAEGYQVVGEAANGEDALALYRRLRPDLMLLDVNIPFKPGDQVLEEVLREFPDAKVVMLTMVADTETVTRCLRLGAVHYVLKNSPLAELCRMLREIVAAAFPGAAASSRTEGAS